MRLRLYLLLFFALLAGAAAVSVRRAAAGTEPAPAKAMAFVPNYVGGPHMGTLRRWKRLPVRVFFDTGGGAYTKERKKRALAGFDQWTTATKGAISYTFVESAAKADITVRFHPGAHLPANRYMLGQTIFATNGPWLTRAWMELATGGGIRPEDLTETAAHEWGHALGINGHSDDPDDVMSAVTTRYVLPDGRFVPPARLRSVTARDLNTLNTCYAGLFATGAAGNRVAPDRP